MRSFLTASLCVIVVILIYYLDISLSELLLIAAAAGCITLFNSIGNISKVGGSHSFINRAKDTSFANEYEILFNLYLVKQNARPAFLLEFANFPDMNHEKLLDDLGKTYPEFTQTIEHQINNIIHRVYFHIHPLINTTHNDDDAIATNLGFTCIGIPPNDIESLIVNYILYTNTENSEINFMTEVCDPNVDQSILEEKKYRFDELAKQLNENWSVDIVMINQQPKLSELDGYISDLVNNVLIDDDKLNYILNMLEGDGITGLYGNVKDGKYTLSDLKTINAKKLLLLSLLMSKYQPLEHTFPLTTQMNLTLGEIETEKFSNLEKDPIIIYKEFISETLDLFQKDKHHYDIDIINKQSMLILNDYHNKISHIK